jgi:hypothetical protein
MKKFFTHRSKSQNVYKRFWNEESKKKNRKPTLSRYTFRKKFRRKVKKNKHIRSKSTFFELTLKPTHSSDSNEKSCAASSNQPRKSTFDIISETLLNIRKDYILRMKAIRRKVRIVLCFP